MIKLIKSTFYKEADTKKRLNKFIKRAKYLSFGKECEKFEKDFAQWQGRRHCVFLNSGSSANLAVIQALLNLGYIKKGDPVAFSSLTWSTNVMPLIQLGLRSIPIDVELETLNISSKGLLEILKKHEIKMLFITNLLGFCGDIDEVKRICKKKGIVLIEDNCESLGSVYKGNKLGNFGLASTFSFYVGHHMSTVEGGAVCTDDEELATMLRIVRAHGWDRNLSFAKQNEIRDKFKVNETFYSRYTFYDLGYNFRPTEINGFLGNIQLKYANEIVKKRKENFMKMATAIYKRSDLYYPVQFDHMDLISNFAIPVICRSRKLRDKLVKKCEGKIEIRPIVGGDMTRQPFFTKYIKDNGRGKTNARLIHDQGLYFGNNPELTNKEIKQIVKVFTEI
ncbi:MAG: DegT/DnrJ/EryC1/StrS family aminotransferase [Patescibacteria group bacterium]